MAIIEGREPGEEPESAYIRRIVVKLRSGTRPAYDSDTPPALPERLRPDWDRLAQNVAGLAFEPYFSSLDQGRMRRMAGRAGAKGTDAMSALTSYFAIRAPQGADLDRIAAEVRGWPEVETAYVEGGPVPPPVNAGDDPRNANQGYLNAAPSGINARWAWSRGSGAGIGFVDLERGWTLNHEDLTAAGITLISGVNKDFTGHGTAVLGELVAFDNLIGGIGIAPGASARVVSQWRTNSLYNTADAILDAADVMNSGDVLLLEAQTSYAGIAKVPVEVELAVFDAIVLATSLGIVVVEAAGNGGVDLDAFTDLAGKSILNRSSEDFRDSGAIMVGAASSTVPHSRLYFSNYGSRIDCYAWGQSIDTAGDGWTGTGTNTYTTSFGGTSGASPIVTGAALILQSWRLNNDNPLYTPGELRSLLANKTLNTASANPASDRIGVMPDLKKIIQPFVVTDSRWRALLYILFGVIQDGGGVVLGPHGPIPVDPWGPEGLSPQKQAILVGLAVTELAGLIEDDSIRTKLTQAGLNAIRDAVEEAEKRLI